MKKIFCAVLALAALASCSKEYIVAEDKQAIGFGEAFVDNGTRADYSQKDKPVQAFNVWGNLTGSYDKTVQIFNGAAVTKPDNYYNNTTGAYSKVAWICTETTQYWVPNADYKFAAIVDCDDPATVTLTSTGLSTGLPETIPFTVKDGTDNKDLLYAEATANVENDGTVKGAGLTADNGLVKFQFAHLLSKVMFTVTSNIDSGYSIVVTGISVTGVAEEGIYTVGAATPWAQKGTATTTLTFGKEGAYETRQILPVQQTLNVTISYDIYFDGTKISAATKSGTIKDKTFEVNTVYNISATITMNNKIEFTVEEVLAWDEPSNNITL